ncbi:MAG: sugar phosphate isomerase/epimerase [Chloroflexi bacterium]|nr:sugar phosphate isomerase/epimerase [Chloroflexota bacterium]
MSTPALAAQLIVFSQQTQLETQMDEVLGAVHSAGFSAIECGTNTFENDPQAFIALLRKHNLRVSALHGGIPEKPEQVMRLMDLYGTQDLCISGVGGWEGKQAAKYAADTQAVSTVGRVLAQRGFHTHYHNHAYEFAKLDNGQSGMEVILTNLDPQAADLCVDVAWVHIGGQNPVEFLKQHKSRTSYIHLKDYTGDRHWVELGSGLVPLAAVVAALPELDIRWAVYEQDTSDIQAAKSCALSYAYLQGLGF